MAVITAIAALASAAAGLISSQYANRASREQMERYRDLLSSERNRTDEKIQRLENEDALQTKRGSALANEARDTLAEQNAAAAGRDAVMGGTGVSAARQKAASTDALRKVYRDIITGHEATVGARLSNLESIRANQISDIGKANLQQANANAQAGAAAIKGAAQIVAAGAKAYGGETSHNGTETGDGTADTTSTDGTADKSISQTGNINDQALTSADDYYDYFYGKK